MFPRLPNSRVMSGRGWKSYFYRVYLFSCLFYLLCSSNGLETWDFLYVHEILFEILFGGIFFFFLILMKYERQWLALIIQSIQISRSLFVDFTRVQIYVISLLFSVMYMAFSSFLCLIFPAMYITTIKYLWMLLLLDHPFRSGVCTLLKFLTFNYNTFQRWKKKKKRTLTNNNL